MAHVDANNLGPSYMIGLGDYTGGELWVADESGNRSMVVEQRIWMHRYEVGDSIMGSLADIRAKLAPIRWQNSSCRATF